MADTRSGVETEPQTGKRLNKTGRPYGSGSIFQVTVGTRGYRYTGWRGAVQVNGVARYFLRRTREECEAAMDEWLEAHDAQRAAQVRTIRAWDALVAEMQRSPNHRTLLHLAGRFTEGQRYLNAREPRGQRPQL